MSDNLLIRCKPQQGYNKIFDVGERKMKLTKFGVVKLAAGTTYSDSTGDMEVALVLIGGNFKAHGDGWAFEVADGRTSPFPSLPLENLKIAFPSKPACVFRLRAS